MKLSSVPIIRQVFALGGIGVLGLLVVFGFQVWTEASQRAMDDRLKGANTVVQKAMDLEVRTLGLRRSEKDFIIRLDMKYAKAVEAALPEVGAAIDGLGAEAVHDAALTSDATALKTGLDAYRKAFADLVQAQVEKGLMAEEGAQKLLRQAVRELEAEAEKAGETTLSVLVLTLRRHEKDYMLRNDGRYVETLAQTVGKTAKLIDGLSLPAERKAALAGLLTKYKAEFDRYVAANERMLAAQKALSGAYATLEPVLDGVVARSKSAGAEMAAVAVAEADRARTVSTGFVLAVITLVLFASILSREVDSFLGKVRAA